MPRGIVTNEKISLALKLDVLIRPIEKDLKDLGIRMGQDQRIEFSGTRTDSSRDVHPNVGSLIGLTDLLPFLSPSPPRARISFDTRLIEIPDLDIRIVQIGFELINKGLSLFLVLSVWPGSGNFQAKSFFMEPTQQGAIPNVILKLLGHISMKFLGSPMDLIGFIGMLDQFSKFVALLGTDLPRPASPRTIEKSVNAALVEPSHPPGECTSGNAIQGTHLLVGETEQQSLYGNAPNISTLPRSSPSSHFQFSKRAVLPIGHVRMTCHAQGKPYSRSDREKNHSANRSFFLSFAISVTWDNFYGCLPHPHHIT